MTVAPGARGDRRIVRRGAFLALVAAPILWTLVPPPAAWVERWYSRGVYPWIAGAIVPVADLVPFSAGFALYVLAPVAAVAWVVASRVRSRRRGVRIGRWGGGVLVRAAAAAVVIYAWFLVVWGAGYRRERIEVRLGLGGASATAEEVSRIAAALARRVASDFVEPGLRCEEDAIRSLRDSLATVIEGWDGTRPALPRRVKRYPPGALLAFGTSGTIVPFILEANVDGAEPDVAFLATAAHELAHLAGLAGEDDADLAAAVAGLRADDRLARYATALRLLPRFARELERDDRERLYATLPPGALEDMRRVNEAARRYHVPTLARAGRRVYDSYLRSQGREEGVKEYSRVVGLLARAAGKGIITDL
jgi:hypothetical protein